MHGLLYSGPKHWALYGEINLIEMNLCITYLADTVDQLETW